VLVLLIHDASDIGVDTLKLVNYTKLRGAKGWFGSEVCTCMSVASGGPVPPSQNPSARNDLFNRCVLGQIAFTLNLISWFYWRLYVYPFFVVYAAFVSSLVVVSAASHCQWCCIDGASV
jgi:hypothetical protein